MREKTTILLCIMLIPIAMWGQSVKCNFTLNTQKVEGTANETFSALRTAATDFINSNSWIDQNLEPQELIECNFVLTINEQIADYEFKGTLQVQAQRPVYNTVYQSVTLNAVDNDVEFRFSPNEALDFTVMSHNANNLTPIFAYWIYVILGIDYDTFAPLGGTDLFRKAERIVQNAQNETKPGWKANSGNGRKNRYWLVENILGKKYEKERKVFYSYHRMGLDLMGAKKDEGTKNILLALQDMQQLHKEKPDNTMYFFDIFFDAKADELVNIFSESAREEKDAVFAILNEVNILNEPKYKKLKN